MSIAIDGHAPEVHETVEKHIDQPMKKIVVGMNLLGIPTSMSCCGYSYDNEAVPKSHLHKTYVYIDSKVFFDAKSTQMISHAFLMGLMSESGWNLKSMGRFLDFYADTWSKGHPWENPNAVHHYEHFVLAINSLERALDKHRQYFLESATVRDGNKIYTEELKIKNWQYLPAADWIVTPETYDKL